MQLGVPFFHHRTVLRDSILKSLIALSLDAAFVGTNFPEETKKTFDDQFQNYPTPGWQTVFRLNETFFRHFDCNYVRINCFL